MWASDFVVGCAWWIGKDGVLTGVYQEIDTQMWRATIDSKQPVNYLGRLWVKNYLNELKNYFKLQ